MTWPSAPPRPADFNTAAASTLGDQPKVFDQLPYTDSGQGTGYNPLWQFAFGLSYTTFTISSLSATGTVSSNGTVTRVHRGQHRPGPAATRAGVRRQPVSVVCPRIGGSRGSPG